MPVSDATAFSDHRQLRGEMLRGIHELLGGDVVVGHAFVSDRRVGKHDVAELAVAQE